MPDPNVSLDPGGKFILWSHECNWANFEGSTWHPNVRLPILPFNAEGWRVERTDPLTVSPSILCYSCQTHGFWRDGKWVGV